MYDNVNYFPNYNNYTPSTSDPIYTPTAEYSPYGDVTPHTYDRIRLGGTMLDPFAFLNYYEEKEFSPRKIFQDKFTKEWKVKERDQRVIVIGKIDLSSPLIVNPTSVTNFAAFYCEMKYNDETYPIVVPEKEFKKRDILPYLSFFQRNPDCSDKYLVDAFFLAIQELTDIKFLKTPERSGWAESKNGELEFASRKSVHPHLAAYYPNDVRERKLIKTTRALMDVAKEYAEALPKLWQYKLLVTIRIASLLQHFFAKEGIRPDQLLVVEPACESAAKTAVALLKTQNYGSQVVLPLTSTKTKLIEALNQANDGMVVIRDSSYIEDWKKRNNGLQILLDSMNHSNGNENNSRHMIAIVSDNPGNLSSELPAIFVNLTDQVLVGDPDKLQRLSGEFDSALIEAIVNDPKNNRRFIENTADFSRIETKTISNSDNFNTKRFIKGGLEIMRFFNLVSVDEKKEILKYIKKGSEQSMDSSTAIVNNFREVFNHLLFSSIKVVPQFGPPYYKCRKNMAFMDKGYINFEAEVVDKVILRNMRKTQKRLKLLQAFQACNLLHSNRSYKRNVEVAIAPGEMKTVSVYSVSKSLLSVTNREKIDELKYPGCFIASKNVPLKDFNPRITNKMGTKVAGIQQLSEMDLNYHQYVSGSSRSGKTKYLCEQAVSVAKNGEQVIIIDHCGGFSELELHKHLPYEITEKYVSHWDVSKQGLPINLANLDHCDTVPEKKQRIFGILASAIQVLGEVQGKVLRKRIAEMLKEKKQITDINNILDYLDEKDEIQKVLRNKLEDVMEDLEDLPKCSDNWSEFLSTQKQIVIISTGSDSVAKSSHLTDMILASLYAYKQYNPKSKYTVILDEAQDLYLDTDAPVDVMLRKGSKHGIHMLLASQEFSAAKDKLGKIIGNCGTLVFFRPKTDNIADISKLIGVDKATLANLEQGQCVYHGLCYNECESKNNNATLIGLTYKHNK